MQVCDDLTRANDKAIIIYKLKKSVTLMKDLHPLVSVLVKNPCAMLPTKILGFTRKEKHKWTGEDLLNISQKNSGVAFAKDQL